MSRLRAFFRRHPLLRDAVIWALPALAFGAALRLLMLSYLPYAYWGSDSKSYYSFAHMLLGEGYVSLDEKRRYLYPIAMVPVSLLPGAPLKWLAWLQHLGGLVTVLPLAYLVRKTLRFWRWWIIPVTAAYVGLPEFLWYEHELLGETLFFTALIWAMGGWMAWVKEPDPARSRRLFWWFFAPLAVFLLTKPSGRFALPGIVCGLAMVRAWRVLDWRRWTALAVLMAVTLTVGSKKQAAWLLYVATFPLTQLDTPANAEYKAELRPIAEPYIRDIDAYYVRDKARTPERGGPFDFLDSPSEEKAPPLWEALDKDEKKRDEKKRLYMELAWEGIKARPWGFLYLGAQRLVPSANLSKFELDRFESGYFPGRLQGLYEEAQGLLAKGKKTSVPMAFGFPKNGPLPPYAEFSPRLSPAPGSWAERTLVGWGEWVHSISDVVTLPKPAKNAPAAEWSIARAWPTPFGWWLIGSLVLSLVYWRTFAVWVLVAMGYLAGVFLVSLVSPRYFAPAWLIFLPVLVVPLDLVLSLFCKRRPA